MAKVDPRAVNIWTSRLIPIVLMGVVGYATYVHVARLCADYLLTAPTPPQRPRRNAATALLVLYFALALPMAAAYIRLLTTVLLDPGYVARGCRPNPAEDGQRKKAVDWHTDADAPGLEEFYSRDVFVCEMDGRPKWCSECACWKPDRAHHCSDVSRCVRKMDHFCPWVGGAVGENSFKFFIQFVFYTTIYCFFLLAVMAYYIHEQLTTPGITYDPHFAAITALATFFGLFTFSMTCSSGNFALTNLTTIESLNKKTKAWQLAVYIPDRQKPPTMGGIGEPFPTVTYPLPLVSEKPSSSSPAPSDATNGDTVEAEHNHTDLPHHAERDARAKRTFAILRMEPGRNPWDLGALGNWKSVMGTNVLDWLLPVRRSPLCNHESAISQFPLGKDFDKFMADHGLVSANDTRRARSSSARRTARRHTRRGSASRREVEMHKYSQQPP